MVHSIRNKIFLTYALTGICMQLSLPSIVIGLGCTAYVKSIAEHLKIDTILISSKCTSEGIRHLMIDSNGVMNPSMMMRRGLLFSKMQQIKSVVEGYRSVILVADLSDNDGVAFMPMIAESMNGMGKQVLSLVAMPFRFERSMLFKAGVALRLVKEMSDVTLIIDKNTLLEGDPELDIKGCNDIIGNVMRESIHAILYSNVSEYGVYIPTLAGTDKPEHMVSRSLEDLYTTSMDVKGILVYVNGDISIGAIESIVKYLQNILGYGLHIDTCAVDDDDIDKSGVLVLYNVRSSRFDSYDPLSIIPVMERSSCDCRVDALAYISDGMGIKAIE